MPKALITPWQLLRQSFGLWRAHLGLLTAIVAIVALPANLLNLFQSSSDSALAGYAAVANALLVLALIWTVKRLDAAQPVSVKQAYYDGTASLVKYFLLLVMLALMLLPLVIGVSIYALGLTGGVTTGLGEKILLGGLGLLVALPTLYWLPRYLLSIYAVEETTPLAALRSSRLAVQGRYWPVLGRLVVLGLVSVGLLLVPSVGLAVAAQITGQEIFLVVLQLISALIFLPLNIIYLHRLYEALRAAG